ncbi:MAG: cytochrome c biogenesis CcdA family protein [Pikeienuella sp.]
MGLDVTFIGAFIAGLASFASPCILPIVPPYLCFLAGVSLDELTGEGSAAPGAGTRILASALAFVLGFSTIFIGIGAAASVLGQFISENFDLLRWIAGGLILIFGLHFLGVLRIGLFYRQAQIQVERRPTTLLGAYLVGLAFGFGWTPCAGPVLGTIVMIAGEQGTMLTGDENAALRGAALLAAYAAGIGLPFLAAAAFARPFISLMRRFRRHLGKVEKAMGAALVITGVLFITNGFTEIGLWMDSFMPRLG